MFSVPARSTENEVLHIYKQKTHRGSILVHEYAPGANGTTLSSRLASGTSERRTDMVCPLRTQHYRQSPLVFQFRGILSRSRLVHFTWLLF